MAAESAGFLISDLGKYAREPGRHARPRRDTPLAAPIRHSAMFGRENAPETTKLKGTRARETESQSAKKQLTVLSLKHCLVAAQIDRRRRHPRPVTKLDTTGVHKHTSTARRIITTHAVARPNKPTRRRVHVMHQDLARPANAQRRRSLGFAGSTVSCACADDSPIAPPLALTPSLSKKAP